MHKDLLSFFYLFFPENLQPASVLHKKVSQTKWSQYIHKYLLPIKICLPISMIWHKSSTFAFPSLIWYIWSSGAAVYWQGWRYIFVIYMSDISSSGVAVHRQGRCEPICGDQLHHACLRKSRAWDRGNFSDHENLPKRRTGDEGKFWLKMFFSLKKLNLKSVLSDNTNN